MSIQQEVREADDNDVSRACEHQRQDHLASAEDALDGT